MDSPTITPDNVQIALFLIIAGPFALLGLFEILSGYALSLSGFFRFHSRDEEPGSFWSCVALHLGLVVFFAWLCFVKLAPSQGIPEAGG